MCSSDLLPDTPGELVADEVLGALEQVLLRLGDGHPRQAFELAYLALLRVLQLGVERFRRLFAVGEALFAARELDEPAFDLFVSCLEALLGSRDLTSPLLDLRLDPGSQLDGLLASLDPCLAAHRLRLALGVLQQLLPGPEGFVEA